MVNEEKKYELIKFVDEEFSLDVNVSPSEDTVWLSQNDIALLFNTTKQNVSLHIKNIIANNELSEQSTVKDFFTVQYEGNRKISRKIRIYNLDMILSIGYRVKSTRGNLFRRWANQVLKQYLLNGYFFNENRIMAYQSNILQLEANYLNIEKRVKEIEDAIRIPSEKLLYEGEIVDAYVFIRKLFFLAKKEITIIDSYADKFLLSMLVDIKVNITIITSSASYLNNTNLQDNIAIIRNDLIHDRFIIIDEIVYMVGTSFNEIGKKRFVIIKSNYLTKEKILK